MPDKKNIDRFDEILKALEEVKSYLAPQEQSQEQEPENEYSVKSFMEEVEQQIPEKQLTTEKLPQDESKFSVNKFMQEEPDVQPSGQQEQDGNTKILDAINSLKVYLEKNLVDKKFLETQHKELVGLFNKIEQPSNKYSIKSYLTESTPKIKEQKYGNNNI